MTSRALTLAPVAALARILVLEDDDAIRRYLTRVLSAYDVVALADGDEGFDHVTRGDGFDLILCDLHMARLSGIALHGSLKRICPDQAERMVFLTGGTSSDDERSALAALGHVCLGKPLRLAPLLAFVERWLGEHARESGVVAARTASDQRRTPVVSESAKTCVACGARSPETDALYTLMGEWGWRPLTSTDASAPMHWRCPTCWEQFKETVTRDPPSSRDDVTGRSNRS